MNADDLTLADLINCKRAAGYDPKFEALMRQPWYCPHCKCSKTLLDTTFPINDPIREVGCSGCGLEGIKPLKGDGLQLFKKILGAVMPYNRAGNA